MNRITLLVLLLLTCHLARAADACPSCCAAPAVAAEPTASLSPRSIYQLGQRWTDDRGDAVSLRRFQGHPVVLAMFFTHCEYACPMLVSDMKRLREALPASARADTAFVLVSFDPARDTPATLRAYRARAALDAGWTLLHGTADDVQELAMVLGVKYQQDARGQFSHSNLITILGPKGEIAHQRVGLQGEVLTAARAVELASR